MRTFSSKIQFKQESLANPMFNNESYDKFFAVQKDISVRQRSILENISKFNINHRSRELAIRVADLYFCYRSLENIPEEILHAFDSLISATNPKDQINLLEELKTKLTYGQFNSDQKIVEICKLIAGHLKTIYLSKQQDKSRLQRKLAILDNPGSKENLEEMIKNMLVDAPIRFLNDIYDEALLRLGGDYKTVNRLVMQAYVCRFTNTDLSTNEINYLSKELPKKVDIVSLFRKGRVQSSDTIVNKSYIKTFIGRFSGNSTLKQQQQQDKSRLQKEFAALDNPGSKENLEEMIKNMLVNAPIRFLNDIYDEALLRLGGDYKTVNRLVMQAYVCRFNSFDFIREFGELPEKVDLRALFGERKIQNLNTTADSSYRERLIKSFKSSSFNIFSSSFKKNIYDKFISRSNTSRATLERDRNLSTTQSQKSRTSVGRKTI